MLLHTLKLAGLKTKLVMASVLSGPSLPSASQTDLIVGSSSARRAMLVSKSETGTKLSQGVEVELRKCLCSYVLSSGFTKHVIPRPGLLPGTERLLAEKQQKRLLISVEAAPH